MAVYTREEGNEIAAHIQALHAATNDAWAAVLDSMTRSSNPAERRRCRERFEREVAEFEASWQRSR